MSITQLRMPKLSDRLISSLDEKLHEIALELQHFDFKAYPSIGYLGGLSGMLFFLFEYGKHYDKPEYLDLGESYIHEILLRLGRDKTNFSFSSGIAGFGYAIEQLFEQGHVESSDILHPFDSEFCQALKLNLRDYNWDALHGAIGISFYLFRRIESPVVNQTIEYMIDWFDDNGIIQGDGKKWKSYMNSQTKEEFNLGLAHGMPSIGFFLCRCIEHNIKKEKCIQLLSSFMNYYVSMMNSRSDSVEFMFPNNEKKNHTGPRLAWCYGDLGISAIIYHINSIIGGYDKLLTDLLISLRSRRDLKASSVKDAGFCHGASGVLHIYHYFLQLGYTQISNRDLEFWLSKCLEFGQSYDHDNYAGHIINLSEKEKSRDIGLLTGITGIGLVYLSLLNGNLSWSKGLMV